MKKSLSLPVISMACFILYFFLWSSASWLDFGETCWFGLPCWFVVSTMFAPLILVVCQWILLKKNYD